MFAKKPGSADLRVVKFDIKSSEDTSKTNIQLTIRKTITNSLLDHLREWVAWRVLLNSQTLSGTLRKSNKVVLEMFTVRILPALGYKTPIVGEYSLVCVYNWC